MLINKNKNFSPINFNVQASHLVKMKEKEQMDKYLNLLRELKKLENVGDWDTNCS